MTTRATYGTDMRGFICKARTLLRVRSLHLHILYTLCNMSKAPGVCLSVKVSQRVLDKKDTFCAAALLHHRDILWCRFYRCAFYSPCLCEYEKQMNRHILQRTGLYRVQQPAYRIYIHTLPFGYIRQGAC